MVRDSRDEHFGELPDGLYYALIHEVLPWSWDARQDLINDYVGYFWIIKDGVEEVEENTYAFRSELEFCEALRFKAGNAIYTGTKHISPFTWLNRHPDYEFQRLVFRKLRSNNGEGPIVRPNGRTCAGVW